MCAFLLGIYYNYPSLFSLVNCIQLNDEAEGGWGEYMIDDETICYVRKTERSEWHFCTFFI